LSSSGPGWGPLD